MSDLALWDFIKARYLASAVKPEQYPETDLPEVAFIGRSNVGKSSLINSLTRNGHLAKTSGTPGKTRTINFFAVQSKRSEETSEYKDFLIVDLPGYGYAKASKVDKKNWSAFIQQYIEKSARLVKIYQLIDVRHGLMPNDAECFSWLTALGTDVGIVFTKADKATQAVAAKNRSEICKALCIDINQTVLYSSVKNTGRSKLIQNIMNCIDVNTIDK